jgi:hypothetical protein
MMDRLTPDGVRPKKRRGGTPSSHFDGASVSALYEFAEQRSPFPLDPARLADALALVLLLDTRDSDMNRACRVKPDIRRVDPGNLAGPECILVRQDQHANVAQHIAIYRFLVVRQRGAHVVDMVDDQALMVER